MDSASALVAPSAVALASPSIVTDDLREEVVGLHALYKGTVRPTQASANTFNTSTQTLGSVEANTSDGANPSKKRSYEHLSQYSARHQLASKHTGPEYAMNQWHRSNVAPPSKLRVLDIVRDRTCASPSIHTGIIFDGGAQYLDPIHDVSDSEESDADAHAALFDLVDTLGKARVPPLTIDLTENAFPQHATAPSPTFCTARSPASVKSEKSDVSLELSLDSDTDAIAFPTEVIPYDAITTRTYQTSKLQPSREQCVVLHHYERMRNIHIEAVAGAGKSTTLLLCAQSNPHKRVVLVTYSKRLQLELESKFRTSAANLKVYTYHGLASWSYQCIVNTDTVFNQMLAHAPANVPHFDVLALDEVQDMTISYYLFICTLLRHKPDAQVLLVGDARQCINEFKGARSEFLTQCQTLFHTSREWAPLCTLSTSYRLTPATAEFVNTHILRVPSATSINHGTNGDSWRNVLDAYKFDAKANVTSKHFEFARTTQGAAKSLKQPKVRELLEQTQQAKIRLIGGNVNAPDLRPLYVPIENFESGAKKVAMLIRQKIGEYGLNQVCLIAATTRNVQKSNNPLGLLNLKYLGEVPTRIVRDDEIMSDQLLENKFVIATYNSMKGSERDCVIVFGLDESYFLYYAHDWPSDTVEVPNLLYVATTRARKELIVVADARKTLRSINTTTLARHVRFEVNDSIVDVTEPKRHALSTLNPSRRSIADAVRALKPHLVLQLKTLYTCTSAVNDHKVSRAVPPLIIAFGTHHEAIGPLYTLVILALAQFRKSGDTPYKRGALTCAALATDAPVAPSNATAPTFGYEQTATGHEYGAVLSTTSQRWECEQPDYVSEGGAFSRTAARHYPDEFWATMNNTDASAVALRQRSIREWLKIVLSHKVLQEARYELARQIRHYDWIDTQFVEESVQCILHVLTELQGRFSTKVEEELPYVVLHGQIDFWERADATAAAIATSGSSESALMDTTHVPTCIWTFECLADTREDREYQLVAQMALAQVSRGVIYNIITGEVRTLVLTSEPLTVLQLLNETYAPVKKSSSNVVQNKASEVPTFKVVSAATCQLDTTLGDLKPGDIEYDIALEKERLHYIESSQNPLPVHENTMSLPTSMTPHTFMPAALFR